MKVVILAGGAGTRLQEETATKPKPMVEIGGYPILWHIMNIYAAYGFREFIIALGYKGDWIKKFFLNYFYLSCDLSVHLLDGHIDVYNGCRKDWVVSLVDTGLHVQTGGRIKRLASVIGNETFMLTYGDGVADININNLLDFHRKQGKIATMTTIKPQSRFGAVKLKGDMVEQFSEKTKVGTGDWFINGGFFVFGPEVFRYINGDETYLEKEPMEKLAGDRQLAAYKHEGFWQCMDVLRDVRFLNNLWEGGNAPWKVWNDD